MRSHRSGRRRGRSWSIKLRDTATRIFMRPFYIVNSFFNYWKFGRLFLSWLDRLSGRLPSLLKFEGTRVRIEAASGERVVSQLPDAQTLANPLWWGVWVVQFPWVWFLSRPYRSMMVAVPGVACLVAVVFVVAIGRQRLRTATGRYRQDFLRLVENENFVEARLLGDILVRADPHSAVNFYNRAVLAEKNGNRAEAKSYMEFSAKNHQSEAAALWLADQVGDRGEIDRWPPLKLEEYVRWLKLALTSNPNSVLARKALADAQRIGGDLQAAYQTLEPIANSDPDTNYLVIVMEKELGWEQLASRRAARMIESNLQLLAKAPDQLDRRMQTARLMVFLEHTAEAASTLEEGLEWTKSAADQSRLLRGLADCHALIADQLDHSTADSALLMQRFQHLQKAVLYDPSSPAVIDAVLRACIEASSSEDDPIRTLREAIVDGVSADAAHFILGTVALYEGNAREALDHLEIAVQSNPNISGILNNLAYAICQQENPDLERALRLCDAAVKTSPENAYARETRGQVYLKMQRWTEAIADLEFALRTAELQALARPGLVLAYDALGQADIADLHRQMLTGANGNAP